MTRDAVAWADFSSAFVRTDSTLAPLTGKRPPAASANRKPAPEPDVAALLEAARAEGLREGEARAGSAAAQAVAAQVEAARAALEAERRRWSESESMALAALIREQVRALEDRLAAGAAEVIRPFLGDALQRQALRELRTIVSPLIEGGLGATVSISGPEDLVGSLADALGLPEGALVIRPGQGPDFRVQVNDTMVETRLQAWSERLRRHLEDD